MATRSKGLDADLWRACAGRTVNILKPNSTVCYFPQGHAENATCSDELAAVLGLPPFVTCRVVAVKLEVDGQTDEVFERIILAPLRSGEEVKDDGEGSSAAAVDVLSYGKVLTQSDANNGGGFSVPRNCADTVFPALDYNAEPPVQILSVRDARGVRWKFRHIYRGTPRRHLLTSGWSTFVNKKTLVAKDWIMFVKKSNGKIGVGIRRALRRDRRSRAEEFAEAVKAAARGDEFEVLYYPRYGAPEFCVKASAIRALGAKACNPGAIVKICVEDEYAARVKSCLGTVQELRAVDPVRWPTSPWKILQVGWDDDADTDQALQHVSPWTIDVVEGTSMYSGIAHSLRRNRVQLPIFPQFHRPLSIVEQYGSLRILPNNTPAASIQGARHFPNGVSIREISFSNRLQYTPIVPQLMNNSTIPGESTRVGVEDCCPITVKPEKKDCFILFGKRIPYPQQRGSSSNSSSDVIDAVMMTENSVENNSEITAGGEALPCMVIMESKISRLSLSHVRSYEELYNALFITFKVRKSDLLGGATYLDGDGLTFNLTEDLPFSDFKNSARTLMIPAPPASSP